MECPRCNSTETRSLSKHQTSIIGQPDSIVRHRYCLKCNQHFDTIETTNEQEIDMTDRVTHTYEIQDGTLVKRERYTREGIKYYTYERIFRYYQWNSKSFILEGVDYV